MSISLTRRTARNARGGLPLESRSPDIAGGKLVRFPFLYGCAVARSTQGTIKVSKSSGEGATSFAQSLPGTSSATGGRATVRKRTAPKGREHTAWGVSPRKRANQRSPAPKGRQQTGTAASTLSSAPRSSDHPGRQGAGLLSPLRGFLMGVGLTTWGSRPRLYAIAPSGLPRPRRHRGGPAGPGEVEGSGEKSGQVWVRTSSRLQQAMAQ